MSFGIVVSGICASLSQSIKIKPTNMYIARARAQFKIHTQMSKLTPVHSKQVVNSPVPPRACHWDCVLAHNFSGMKRTCWTTGSWRCYLSLELSSSTPAGSTMICRFLSGIIYVSCAWASKLNQQICMTWEKSTRTQPVPISRWSTEFHVIYRACWGIKQYHFPHRHVSHVHSGKYPVLPAAGSEPVPACSETATPQVPHNHHLQPQRLQPRIPHSHWLLCPGRVVRGKNKSYIY